VTITVAPFTPGRGADFDALHSDANGAGWCRCVAWWVPTWDDWGDRTADENAALRYRLCAGGEYDGLLAYDGATPVGWCQVGRRDRLGKLVAQLELEPDPAVWAVTCFLVAPSHRRRGVAQTLLVEAIAAARDAGAERLEGYPREEAGDVGDMWTGPRELFERAGFEEVRAGAPRSVLSLDLRR
jgi:GNAT superfamily N-acetyltransferase